MARTPLSDEQIEAFRARAIDIATEMFATHGFDGLTMRALADALGVSPMTPYRYFEDKDELFMAVRIEATRRFADHQQRHAICGGSDVERLISLAKSYLHFAITEPDAYRTIFELRPGSSPQNPELAEHHRRAFSFLRTVTQDLVQSGVLSGDPLTLAHLMWAQVHGVVSLHLAGKLTNGRSFEQLCAAMDQLLRSWTTS